jgi:KipI family sensor histidine kinase inhibitor
MTRVLPYGAHALLVELDDLDHARRFAAALRQRPVDGIREIVPGARTVVVIASGEVPLARIARELSGVVPVAGTADLVTDRVEIRVRYDGADLAEVARLVGSDMSGVVAIHTGQTWTVAFAGFLPGFGYLVGENDALHVPRRDSPRTKVPAGAIGLAGEFTGAYPRASPGGWQLIGRTDAALWDAARNPPALFRPGTRVRFVAVDESATNP